MYILFKNLFLLLQNFNIKIIVLYLFKTSIYFLENTENVRTREENQKIVYYTRSHIKYTVNIVLNKIINFLFLRVTSDLGLQE